MKMAVPPVIMLVLINVVTSDRVFALGRLAGNALPSGARRVARFTYTVANALGVGAAALALSVQCEAILTNKHADVTADAACFPAVTLAAVALLLLLFADRVWLNLLDASGSAPGPATRAVHGATVVALFMTLSKPEDAHVFPLLLLAACNRASGVVTPPHMLSVARLAFRAACACAGVVSLLEGTGGRQTAALAIVCAALSR